MKCKKCKGMITLNMQECPACGETNELYMSQKKQAGCLLLIIIPIIIAAIVQANKPEIPVETKTTPAIKQQASLPEIHKKLSGLYSRAEQLVDPKFFNKLAWGQWNNDLYHVGGLLKQYGFQNEAAKQLRLAYAQCLCIFQGYKDFMSGKSDQELEQAKKLAAEHLQKAKETI